MTTWSAHDLERRVCRVLDLAERVIVEFAATGFVDSAVPYNSFGPEKVVAETAMLLYVASDRRHRPEIGRRVDAVARRLVPHARSRRALVEMALHPARAFKMAVPHVLLTKLGYPDDEFDMIAHSRCSFAASLASDLPVSATIERSWLSSIWEDGDDVAAADRAGESLLERPIDVLNPAREDAYGLTHILFYLTDFGHRPLPSGSQPLSTILAGIEALLLRYLDAEDYDVSGELLMAWPLLQAPWSPAAAFAFRVLAQVEDDVGLLPCGNVDLDRLARLDGDARARYALATGYHTAFVMGFLGAVSLSPACQPPVRVEGDAFGASAVQDFLRFVRDDQGHWLERHAEADADEQKALAPALCQLAVVQALRRYEYEELREILLLATKHGLPPVLLRDRATDILLTVAACAAL